MENSTRVFPREICEDILSRLPVKTLKRFKCVSKTWSEIITSTLFVGLHLSRSKQNILNFHVMMHEMDKVKLDQDDEKFTVVYYDGEQPPYISICNVPICGSCDGLLLATTPIPAYCMFLWNPSTRECKKLPAPHTKVDNDNPYGFGYNANTMDYEVVTILLGYGDVGCHAVQVYSLRNNSWRRLEDISYYLIGRCVGQLVHGKLYWRGPSCLVSYELATEKFKEVPAPLFEPMFEPTFDPMIVPEPYWHNLVALGESYLYYFINHGGSFSKGWVMKDDGLRISWTKMIEERCGSLDILFSTKEGKSVMLRDGNVVCYDARNGNWKNLMIEYWLKRLLGMGCTFTPSLVALGVGTEKMRNTAAASHKIEFIQSDLSELRTMTIDLIN